MHSDIHLSILTHNKKALVDFASEVLDADIIFTDTGEIQIKLGGITLRPCEVRGYKITEIEKSIDFISFFG